MKNKKAQAAVEFLTTYSWALMVIFLTIGALTYFDVFNTSRFLSERCETGAQISCVEAQLRDGELSLMVTNNYPVAIEIESLKATPGGTISNNTILGPGGKGEIRASADADGKTRQMFDVEITFKRSGGDNKYNVTGSVVVRPTPTD